LPNHEKLIDPKLQENGKKIIKQNCQRFFHVFVATHHSPAGRHYSTLKKLKFDQVNKNNFYKKS